MSDNQWPGYDPGGADDPSPWGREPTVTPSGGASYGPPITYDAPQTVIEGRRHRHRLLPAFLTAIVVAGGVAGISFLVAGTDDDPAATGDSSIADDQPEQVDDPDVPDVPDVPVVPVDEEEVDPDAVRPDPEPVGTPELLTADGFGRLVDAVRERTGSTAVFEAVVYPGYAVVDLPVDDTTLREESVRWDGAFAEFGAKGTAREERIDLARVDPRLLTRLVAQAGRLVEDPTTRYVIIRGRSTVFDDDGARIFAYASNDFGETAYVATTRDGTVVRRITP